MANKTYGQVASQGLENTTELLGKLLQMVKPFMQPEKMAMNTAMGMQQGIANTEVGQNPMQNIMAEVAKKTLTKRLTAHAEQTPDEVLAQAIQPDPAKQQGVNPENKQANLAPQPLAGSQDGGDILSQLLKLGGQPQQQTAQPGMAPQQPQGMQMPQLNQAPGFFGGASADQAGNVTQEGIGNQLLRMLTGLGGTSTNQAILQQGAMLDNTGKRQKLAGQEPLQPKDRQDYAIAVGKAGIDRENKILEQERADTVDFNKATEDYRTILPRYATIKEMVLNPKAQQANGIGDLTMINETLKIIDPTTANREGEVKTWREAESRLARAGLAWGKGWRTGEKLTPEGRKQILKAMTVKYNQISKDAEAYHGEYSKKIKGYGGKPERALTYRSLDKNGSGGGVKITSIKEIK